MNSFKIAKVIVIISSLSYLSLAFLRNYNSPENIEKRCMRKFEKDFNNPIDISQKEWDLILDFADSNYLKCMGMPQD